MPSFSPAVYLYIYIYIVIFCVFNGSIVANGGSCAIRSVPIVPKCKNIDTD